jgi:hypothetical protein
VPLGIDGYIAHPRFDVYLVSIVTSTGLEWVGHPKDAPWESIDKHEWEWLAHNSSFDERIFDSKCDDWKVSPYAKQRPWHCTADLCAYSGSPRSLALAAKHLYNEKISKSTRDKMKGVVFATLSPEKQEEVKQYALKDARTCLRFWNDLSPKWPDKERRLSRLTRQQGWYGVAVDTSRVERGIGHLKNLSWAAGNLIPWDEPKLSHPKLVEECSKAGIKAPSSIDMNSDECSAWEEKYGEQYPWIDGMRTLRRTNSLCKKLEVMRDRTRPDGRMGYAMKYFGAHTGRWSGGGGGEKQTKETGFNPQNLPRREMFGEQWFDEEGKRFEQYRGEGADLRRCIIPSPGNHFLIADLAQIEPRVLWTAAGDEESLALVRKGISPYVAHAMMTMNCKPEKGTQEYQLAKARVLALGYGCGWFKFLAMARLYIDEETIKNIFSAPVNRAQVEWFEIYLKQTKREDWNIMWAGASEELRTTYVNSWLIVQDFRASNPKIVKLWRKFSAALKTASADEKDDFKLRIPLPSGRELVYDKVEQNEGEPVYGGWSTKYGRYQRFHLYGGLLVENAVQATARDVFADCLLRIDDAGLWTALQAHDEAVIDAPLSVKPETVEQLMSQPPSWWPQLPVAAECSAHSYYTK